MLKLDNTKPWLNKVALIISCLMVAHFFASFSDQAIQKFILGFVGVFIDVTAQFILALSKLRLKQKNHGAAFLLFVPYIVYIIVFAIPSAIGYCATGFAVNDDVKSKQAYAENLNKTRLAQIGKELKVINMQLEMEARNGGYGDKSKVLMDRVDKLSAEQKSLQESFLKSSAEVSKSSGKGPAKVSEVLSKVYQLPENQILIILFSVATGMIYLTLILTSWDLEQTIVNESVKESAVAEEPAKENVNAKKIVKKHVKRSDTANEQGKWKMENVVEEAVVDVPQADVEPSSANPIEVLLAECQRDENYFTLKNDLYEMCRRRTAKVKLLSGRM